MARSEVNDFWFSVCDVQYTVDRPGFQKATLRAKVFKLQTIIRSFVCLSLRQLERTKRGRLKTDSHFLDVLLDYEVLLETKERRHLLIDRKFIVVGYCRKTTLASGKWE